MKEAREARPRIHFWAEVIPDGGADVLTASLRYLWTECCR
jgi:hypothetical protein